MRQRERIEEMRAQAQIGMAAGISGPDGIELSLSFFDARNMTSNLTRTKKVGIIWNKQVDGRGRRLQRSELMPLSRFGRIG